MSKLLIFNFDGTGNEPSDADQDIDYKGAKEDDNISNILKFHLMLGGNLYADKRLKKYGSSLAGTEQKTYYYHGVGTYGSRLKRLVNTAIALPNSDVATILNNALDDFEKEYTEGDKILVTGFSRGAALARRFVALIEKSPLLPDTPVPFVYEALYDTVASIGIPNMSKSDRPDSDVIFENGHSLPSIVIKALHCISMDDKRKAFQPTLMNYQQGVVHEVWFAGAHSDVGGGYYRDRLSDISLEYFLNWIADTVPEAKYSMPTSELLQAALPSKVKYSIGLDDLARNPSPFGKNHQQDRFPVVSWLTLTDRECCVIENDRISDRKPLVHWSIATRINGDGDYRPKSLKNEPHTIIYADGKTVEGCIGFNTHINTPRSDLYRLNKIDDEVEVIVFASQQHNHTGLMLEQGGRYKFWVKDKSQQWNDASIECKADGWNNKTVHKGIVAEAGFKLMEPFRRVPKANWFCLCGCVTDDDDYAFQIGNKPTTRTIKKSGEFLPFANDKKTHYGNNDGKIKLLVKKIS